jgi:hypothetical protein
MCALEVALLRQQIAQAGTRDRVAGGEADNAEQRRARRAAIAAGTRQHREFDERVNAVGIER